MAEFIDKQAFLEEQRHLYCENCEKRKGMKRGKMQFVYEIGDAPCRSCGYGDVLDDLENIPAADVRPVVKAHWVDNHVAFYRGCPECGAFVRANLDEVFLRDFPSAVGKLNFCPNCGADMREES